MHTTIDPIRFASLWCNKLLLLLGIEVIPPSFYMLVDSVGFLFHLLLHLLQHLIPSPAVLLSLRLIGVAFVL